MKNFMILNDVLKRFDNLHVFYDIGAHDGDFTRKFKNIYKQSKFYMFEASPNKRERKNGEWHSVVLSHTDFAEVDFYHDGGTGDTYYRETDEFLKSKYNVTRMTTRRLDSYTAEKFIPLPDVIKIDVQGAELDILGGCDDILNHCRVLHCEVPVEGIEFNEGSPTRKEYFDFLASHGFVYKYHEKDHIRDKKLIIQHDYIFTKVEI